MDLGVLGRTLIDAADAAGIGVMVTRVELGDMRHLYVSEAAAKLFGRTADEMLLIPPTRHIAPSDRARIRDAIANGETHRPSYELSIVRKDGSVTLVEVMISETVIEGQRAVFSFLVDKSGRIAAEEQRARSEAQFRALIEMAPEPIGIIRDGRFVYANPAFAHVLGHDDPTKMEAALLSSLLSEDEAAIGERREARLMRGEAVPRQLYRLKRPDGSFAELDVSSILFEYQGQPAILTMGRDVTATRALERQLVQADRLAAIGTVTAGVAHEINNPLAYVLLNLDWITRTLRTAIDDPSSVDNLMSMLADARHGVEHVATIVRELKAFSRGDTETRMPVDLQGVAQSAIKIADHEVRQRATVRTKFEPAPHVWANDARLEQVIVNLLINAAQALPRETSYANHIVVSVAPTGDDRVALEVTDNGCGIPAEVLPRIFDPFFTTKPFGIGTGLGLSICRGIITSLGGTIAAFSAAGNGTTFRVTLPAANAGSQHAPAGQGHQGQLGHVGADGAG